MALRVALFVDGDASGAKEAAEQAGRAIRDVGTAADVSSRRTIVAGTRAAGGVGAIGNTAKLSAVQLQNLQFQLQDVAIGLGSGQSFGRVMLQQGSQIVQMFGPGGSVQGALKAVGAGVFSFVTNPLNLGLLAFTATGVAAAALFSAVAGGADDADTALEHHKALIDEISKSWPEARKQAKAYFRESTGIATLKLGGDIESLKRSLVGAAKDIRDELTGITLLPSGQFSSELQVKPDYAAFAKPIEALIDQIKRGTPDIRGFRDAVRSLADLDPENGELQRTARSLLDMSDAGLELQRTIGSDIAVLSRLSPELQTLARQADTYSKSLRDLSSIAVPKLSDREKALRDYRAALGAATDLDQRRDAATAYAASLDRIAAAERKAAAEEARRAGLSASRAATAEIERQSQGVIRLIGSLQDEYDLLGASDRERAVSNALRRAGGAATEEQQHRIEGLVGAIYDWKEAQGAIVDQLDSIRSTGHDALQTIVGDIREGASAGKIFADVLTKIGTAGINRGVAGLENVLFGARGSTDSGLFGSLSGLIASGVGATLGSPFGAGIPSFLYHGGGIAGDGGSPTRLVDPAVFASAPRFHQGGIASGEVPAVLLKGEEVGFPSQLAQKYGGKQELTINVNVSGARGNREIEEMVAKGVGSGLSAYGREQERIRKYQS